MRIQDRGNLILNGKHVDLGKNIGEVPRNGNPARFIGFIILALAITFGLLSMGMCALWCRRQYKRYFIEERRQRENIEEIVAGQVHYDMYKNE